MNIKVWELVCAIGLGIVGLIFTIMIVYAAISERQWSAIYCTPDNICRYATGQGNFCPEFDNGLFVGTAKLKPESCVTK